MAAEVRQMTVMVCHTLQTLNNSCRDDPGGREGAPHPADILQ